MINLEYGHRCSTHPVEAAVYGLEAKGEELEMFRANASAELTVELEGPAEEQDQRKQKHTSLELPLYFTKEYLANVLSAIFVRNLLTENYPKHERFTLLSLMNNYKSFFFVFMKQSENEIIAIDNFFYIFTFILGAHSSSDEEGHRCRT